jgi:hypothetical protein
VQPDENPAFGGIFVGQRREKGQLFTSLPGQPGTMKRFHLPGFSDLTATQE